MATNIQIANQINQVIGNAPVPFNSIKDIAQQIYDGLSSTSGTTFEDIYSVLSATLPFVSGDEFTRGITYTPGQTFLKAVCRDISGITEVVDVDGQITNQLAAYSSCNILRDADSRGKSYITKLSLPECTILSNYVFGNTPYLREIYLPKLETAPGNSAYGFLAKNITEIVTLPKLTLAGAYFMEECKSKEIYLPKCNSAQADWLRSCTELRKLYIPLCIGGGSGDKSFNGDNKLIDITIGENITTNEYLLYWNPTEALRTDSTSLVEEGESFSSNREKLLYNIREHIVANLPDRTGQDALTFYFHTNMKNAINGDTATADAFTNKNYIIA